MLKVVTVAAFAVAAAVAPAFAEVAVPSLVGSYTVTGTDPAGKKYSRAATIALSSSGALELERDNGKSVGVGHVIGNVLAVAFSGAGRAAILVMNINPDARFRKWWRRTDPGSKDPRAGRRRSNQTRMHYSGGTNGSEHRFCRSVTARPSHDPVIVGSRKNSTQPTSSSRSRPLSSPCRSGATTCRRACRPD